ncbi:N-terminal nucleophile aminohydrolase [Sistotremastrum niveocremeum HHB9708]|uniref:N-terminal nucleophile aminohydrolase n=1 Tax=Sistotremastrum niveocremeum HHB9708 TaxID=1314777 RepID=A0A165AAJ7_9AGAM|nr:N-terminal nucleophile aminohydrolase [Sistotremastrum niveocremeum HHB9708]
MILVLHAGAGFYPPSDESRVKASLKRACIHALQECSLGSAEDVVAGAIAHLEDDESLNAGTGSNLTYEGSVECDASIMTGTGEFGGVGAVKGIKNPIRLAHQLLRDSRVRDPIGRSPPLTLVSTGAEKYAASSSVTLTDETSMITPKAREVWQSWREKRALALANDQIESVPFDNVDPQDTVGAIAMSSDLSVAAGSSSGGILLKQSGRLGPAAVFGSACWAQDDEGLALACRNGEKIIRESFAREIGRSIGKLGDGDVHETLERLFQNTERELA